MPRTKSKSGRKAGGARKSKGASRGRTKAKRTPARSKASSSRAKTKTARKARSPATKRKAAKATRLAGSKRGRTTASKRAATRPQTGRAEEYGEGNYTASREFIRDQTGFVRKNRRNIPKMGREAEEALEGREGAELRAAETEAASHAAGEDEE